MLNQRITLRQHIRANLDLALPVMVTNLGHVLMGVCDNVMVGHINATSLAAAGLATVAFNVLLLFGIGVSYAITTLVAEADGARDEKRISEILRHGLIINVLNGVVLAFLVMWGKRGLYYINQPEEVVDLAIPYLTIITFSLIPTLVYQSFKQFAEGLSDTRVAMMVVLISNVLNIGLNYTLIYGHFGFEPMGLNGAGYATFISRIFMAIFIGAYIFYAPAFRKYRSAFSISRYSRALFSRLLHLGIPSGVQFIFEVAAFDFSLIMMGWLGMKTQAAHQIVINMATLSYMTTAGLAAAATVRVGYFLGKRDIVNIKTSAYSLLVTALLWMTTWALIFVMGRHFLPTLYVHDPEVISIASTLLVIAALFQLSDGTQVVCLSALRGLQDVKVPSLLIFVAYWIIALPLGYWLAFRAGLGAEGVWYGLLTGLTLTALIMYVRFHYLLRNVAHEEERIPVP
jgi:multidrug resistance protein, MATE family